MTKPNLSQGHIPYDFDLQGRLLSNLSLYYTYNIFNNLSKQTNLINSPTCDCSIMIIINNYGPYYLLLTRILLSHITIFFHYLKTSIELQLIDPHLLNKTNHLINSVNVKCFAHMSDN